MNVSAIAAGFVVLGVVGQSASNSTNYAPWSMSAAHADSASVRAELVGTWRPIIIGNGDTDPRGDTYTLRRNGTYSFRAGTGKRNTGNLEHSGTWRVANSGRTLRLHATRRVVLEGRHRRTLSADRNFTLSVVGPQPSGTVTLNGQEFGN